jgi:transcriptional regulator with XRE-family HTH domain
MRSASAILSSMRTEVRDARVRAGLSQASLARLAGVPRAQVASIENGGNVTLKTFEKVIMSIPGLTRLHLGEVELALTADDEQNRLDAMEAMAIMRRLLDRLGGPIVPVGASRFSAGGVVSPEVVRHLEGLIGAILRGEEPTTEFRSASDLRRLAKKKE